MQTKQPISEKYLLLGKYFYTSWGRAFIREGRLFLFSQLFGWAPIREGRLLEDELYRGYMVYPSMSRHGDGKMRSE